MSKTSASAEKAQSEPVRIKVKRPFRHVDQTKEGYYQAITFYQGVHSVPRAFALEQVEKGNAEIVTSQLID